MTKKIVVGILLSHCLFSLPLSAQVVISSDSLLHYVDQNVRVCDDVKGIFIAKNKKVTFLNFGRDYPKQKFVGVIFQTHLSAFSYDPVTYLKNKYICVEGKVKLYKKQAEIIIASEKQIIFPEEELQKRRSSR